MIAEEPPSDQPPRTGGGGSSFGMVAITLTPPREALDDAAFFEAAAQADGPCDGTRNAQLLAWADFVVTAYGAGAAVVGTSALTAATAGATAPVTIFVTAAASFAVQRQLNSFYGAAKENQLCRLRNRLYPYNHA